ncbi:MAG: TetR family transcriptional regulator [Rhodococcus qingshengii]|uniref:TetR/AcrR family transcriptional regulator n=1 Tax=Rhodococcus qingshengii TaxID=334542 RepID=UPI00071CCB64|nr:TetR/AcrR family transcriptional regulator [Rhodococcus qingshengii]KSU77113.1 TetR family transcriptional regulator [Rhodococcus qingshengii]RGP46183.1 TetR family transcriptional regulator [Rhodococcus erythropolis]THJ69030.1 helix-turn-helix transcriptional regulator [Rhodococcus qingshengii]SCC36778.1 transcriptional regulator, TetR family [Rhodococcus qingshengii]
MSSGEASILTAAKALFAERGYASTTIKDIAVAAGYSPALVMKIYGSKSRLYSAAIPSAPPMDEDPNADATGDIGCQLVEKLVARRESDETDPWAMLAVHVHEAPDPAAARAEIKQRYVHGIARRIGDTEPGLVRSQIVVSLLLGLATGMRTLELLGEDSLSSEDLIRRYGRLIQIAVDEIEPVSEHESFISDTVEE